MLHAPQNNIGIYGNQNDQIEPMPKPNAQEVSPINRPSGSQMHAIGEVHLLFHVVRGEHTSDHVPECEVV